MNAPLSDQGKARWWCSAWLAGHALIVPAVLAASPTQAPLWQGAYVEAHTQAWSNGLPVMDFDGPWDRGYERRDGWQRAYQSAQAEAGVILAPELAGRRWPVRIGAVARADALVAMSGPAAQLAYHYQSETDPAQAGRYDARSRALAWQGQGVAVQWPTLALGSIKMDVGMQWLVLGRLRRSASSGEAGYDGLGTYDYALALEDDNDRTRAPFMSPGARRGSGASLSVGWRWDPSEAWSLSLKVDDAWSRLRWRGIHSDRSTLDSNTVTRAPDGTIDYQPLLSGQYTRRTLSVSIPITVRAGVVWHRPEGDWSVNLNERWGLRQTWLGWQSPGAVRWSAAVEPRFGAVQLGMTWSGFQASLMADRLDRSAHVRAVQLTYVWTR